MDGDEGLVISAGFDTGSKLQVELLVPRPFCPDFSRDNFSLSRRLHFEATLICRDIPEVRVLYIIIVGRRQPL